MINAGDFAVDQTVFIPINTFDGNGGSVTITDLVAADIHIHKDGGTTQRSSSSGVVIDIDFDSITGGHLATIDLSDNADAGFYASGSDYQVRIEGTTVDGQTINSWIGMFSIENRFMRGTNSANTTKTGYSLSAGGIDSIFDEVLTAASHNINNSAGKILRNLKEYSILDEGTLQGATVDTVTLNGGASSTNNFYKHTYIAIVSGLGAGQSRMIESYVGATKVAEIVADNWVVVPNNTSDYIIYQYAVADAHEVYNVEDKTGYSLSPAGIDGIWDETFVEPSAGAPPATTGFRVMLSWLWMHFRNKGTLNKTTGEAKIFNNAGTELAKGTDTDDGTTFTKGKLGAP